MPYKIEKKGSKYCVVKADTGEVVPGGDHPSEPKAKAHLAALEANVPEAAPVEKMTEQPAEEVSGKPLPKGFFVPLTKIDQARREVWGWAAVEEPDASGEIMDYPSSKPYWQKWSEGAKVRSGGKSLGNLRSMHKAIASGRLIHFQPDDENKGIFIGANVVDDDEWRKVETGTYTGFSVGGSYVRKWRDYQLNKNRYTAEPIEVSLVDAPCIPSATFQVIKADGLTELRKFEAGDGSNLLKVIPESPDPIGSKAPEETNETIEVVMFPVADKAMQLSPTDPPSGETLADRHLGVQELTADAGELGMDVTTAVKKLREALDAFKLAWEAEHPAPALHKIKVTPRAKRMIKVRQSPVVTR